MRSGQEIRSKRAKLDSIYSNNKVMHKQLRTGLSAWTRGAWPTTGASVGSVPVASGSTEYAPLGINMASFGIRQGYPRESNSTTLIRR